MSGGSWQAFADALDAENRALGELGAAALAMTSALVFGTVSEIESIDREIDAKRILHAQAHVRRTIMMKSGFGEMSLRQVCSYAPPTLRRGLYLSLREMITRGIALQITVRNNKALILAGLQRISNTIAVLQKSLTDEVGTYRRRGTFAPSNSSLIVSRRA